ncbi:MAG: DUF2007 domain-containing protein [Dokdonella sp.]
MRRIYWAAEAQDAHIVEALLRGHGIGAWSFDTGIVRLDWLKTLAFGGCRVMVADADAERAHHVVAAYRGDELALTGEEIDSLCCPRCQTFKGEDDPLPRRLIFLVLIVSDPLMAGLLYLFQTPPAISLFAAAWIAFNVALIFPGVAGWVVKSRFRCMSCGHAWRAPTKQTFREMSRIVECHQIEADVVITPTLATP